MASKKKPLALSDDVIAAIREYGRQGGKARARKLSQARRSAIAKQAAAARWKKPEKAR